MKMGHRLPGVGRGWYVPMMGELGDGEMLTRFMAVDDQGEEESEVSL